MARQKKVDLNNPSVDLLVSGLERHHGKGVIFVPGSSYVVDVPKISYGSLALDRATGGGCPRSRIIEVFGPESSGKTTLALGVVAQAQTDPYFIEAGRFPLFVDAEHALDLKYAQALGVDTDKVIISQPESGEQALQVLETCIKSGLISVAVVDSVSTLVPEAELKGDIGDSHVGLQARLMSQALRILTPLCAKTETTLIFINQIRMKIGVMFGNPETTSGGQALKFYASQRLDVRRIGTQKDKTGEAIANVTRIKVVKNKVAPPYRTADIDIKFGIGFDLVAEVLDLAVEYGLVLKSGSWYSWPNGDRLAQGRDSAIIVLRENPEAYQTLRTQVRELLFSTTPTASVDDDLTNDYDGDSDGD